MFRLLYWFVVEPLAVVGLLALGCWLLSAWRDTKLSWATCFGVGTLLGIPLWFLLPAWDTELGRARFSDLCTSEAGVTVHRVINVPSVRPDDPSLPDFFDPLSKSRASTNLEDLFGKSYRFTYSEDVVWNGGPVSHAAISRHQQHLYLRETGELLGERTTFYFTRGGPPWPAHSGRERCGPGFVVPENHIGETLARAVFRRRREE